MSEKQLFASKIRDNGFAEGVDWATPHIWNEAIEAAAKEVVERCVGMGRREIGAAILRLKK